MTHMQLLESWPGVAFRTTGAFTKLSSCKLSGSFCGVSVGWGLFFWVLPQYKMYKSMRLTTEGGSMAETVLFRNRLETIWRLWRRMCPSEVVLWSRAVWRMSNDMSRQLWTLRRYCDLSWFDLPEVYSILFNYLSSVELCSNVLDVLFNHV